MNTTRITTRLSLTLAAAVAATAIASSFAGEIFTGRGGATRLMKAPTYPTVVATRPAACGGCKDEFVTRHDPSARGASKPSVRLVRHLCGTCGTGLTARGPSETKPQAATPGCPASGAQPTAACCY